MYTPKNFSLTQLLAATVVVGATLSPIQAATRELKTVEEYRSIDTSRPRVVVFNSATCQFCEVLEKAVNEVSPNFAHVDFYKLNLSEPQFESLRKELEIKGYPTSHFLKAGSGPVPAKDEQPGVQRGGIEAAELTMLVNTLLNGNKPVQQTQQRRRTRAPLKAPLKKAAPQPVSKKSC